MKRFEQNLRIPGPTALPPSVREAGARQMMNHRGPDFPILFNRILSRLRPWFGTEGEIAILSSVGTGGLEAAVVNTVSPGDRVLAATMGVFGERIALMAQEYGADVARLDVEWGKSVDPDALRDSLRANPGVRVVFLTHNETSTGVLNPVEDLVAVCRDEQPEALIVVDTVSAVGSVPFEMARWGVDLAISGSQKGWMAAPGVAMIAVSERAWSTIETARSPRFYLDLRKHREAQKIGMTAWTPPLGVIFQLDAGLELMAEEGMTAVFERHQACAAATRAGLQALGFELFADARSYSPTVTSALIPDGLDWKAFNASAVARGLILAEGLGHLAGRIFRIGHLGSVTLGEIIDVIAILEETLIESGRSLRPGTGIAAAQAAALERIGVVSEAVPAR